ncbi:MAG: glycosyltransferase [Candidatus Omnitrophica bacterium]|nr:glycosyltransferase [Candidatus Omnitrophota bacterium]MDD5512225.1 glycosyltransferase [Candidatus Omnitrophota bacterium]
MNEVCVLVYTCNRPDDLKRCLDSLLRQTYSHYKIMAVNNSADLPTRQILTERKITAINDQTKRLSYLFNLGWKNSPCEYIAYLADDAEVDPQWLFFGMESFKRHPEAAVVTGPFISASNYTGEMHVLHDAAQKNAVLRLLVGFYENFVMEGRPFAPGRLFASGAYSLGQGFEPTSARELEVDLATTSCMLIRRSALLKVNGFDENFIFNHADGDLFVRLKKNGYKIIYNPQMRGVHYNRLGPSRYPFFIGRDTAFFYLKNIRPGSVKGVLAAMINITTLNLYWVYKTVETRNPRQLAGIYGFFRGILDYLFRKGLDKNQ